MKTFSPLWFLRAVLVTKLVFLASSASAAVTAGGLAIIGYDDNEDSFTVVAVKAVTAGEVVYFTNNGWNTALGQFNGAATDQGAGNESLIKLTATDTIAKGTVFSSKANGDSWAWTKSGLVPGQDGGFGEFSDLSLDYDSDQIYIFQGNENNPMLAPTNFIYAMHFGSVDNPTFSDSEDSLTGAIPPGLSESFYTAFAHTDLTMHGDADGMHSAWGLDLSSSTISAMQAGGAHGPQWLEAIANSSNWSQGQPTVSALSIMPEPSRALLLGVGGFGLMIRRRRYRKCDF